MKNKVLFLCAANSSRSKMAEGLTNYFWSERIDAFSAGTEASFANPLAIEAMKEIGIDISGHRSKNLSEFEDRTFDCVITLCGSAHDACPLYIGGTKKTHICFDDPAAAEGTKEERLREFRRVRHAIKEHLAAFIKAERITD